MPQPPSSPFISRELVREIPFAAQKTFKNAALANGATMVAAFDIALAVTDPNQFLTPATLPSADPTQHAIGPFLDWVVFSDVAVSVLTEYAVDYTCSYHELSTILVPGGTLTNMSALRITARFCRVTLTNSSGGNADVEFGCYVRSR